MARRSDDVPRRDVRPALVRAAGLLALAGVEWTLTRAVAPLQRWDDATKLFASRHELNDAFRHAQLPHIRAVATGLAILTAVLLASALLTAATTLAARVACVVAPVAAAGVGEVLKSVVPQPDVALDPVILRVSTFPSVHVAFVVACAGGVVWLTRRGDEPTDWREIAGRLLVPLVMLTVVAGGMHRSSDAVAGALVGAAAIVLARAAAGNVDAVERAASTLLRVAAVTAVAVLAAILVAPTHAFAVDDRAAGVDRASVLSAVVLVVCGLWIGRLLAPNRTRDRAAQPAPLETRSG